MCQAVPGLRVRLGSLEPRTVTEDFCRRLAALPNLCPHFHLSLQSGVRRHPGPDEAEVRHRPGTASRWTCSGPTFSGRPSPPTSSWAFPGRRRRSSRKPWPFVRSCGFARMHLFPYSRRKGTPAAAMAGQVPNAEKARRVRLAGEAAAAAERSWLTSWVGQAVPVLFEEEKEGFWRGYTPQYLEVLGPGTGLHNQIKTVTITAAGDTQVFGTITQEEKPMSRADEIFQENCRQILSQGTWDRDLPVRPRWDDGTPAHTIKLFGLVNRYDLRAEFPIQTIRRMYLKSAVDELLWIWQKKSHNVHDLHSHIWDAWADETGSIGKAYGYQLGSEAPLPRGGHGPGGPGALRFEAQPRLPADFDQPL